MVPWDHQQAPVLYSFNMDDYLKSGRVNPQLDVLNRGVGSSGAPVSRKEELYLSGYGRQWGEKLTYSTGVAYASGEFKEGSAIEQMLLLLQVWLLVVHMA